MPATLTPPLPSRKLPAHGKIIYTVRICISAYLVTHFNRRSSEDIKMRSWQLFLAFALTVAVGCGQQSRWASQLATPTGPIAIEAQVDGTGVITTQLDGDEPSVIFTGGNHRIVIEQSRIMIDDEAHPPAPAGTKTINIDVRNGLVEITADGRPVVKKQ